MISTGLPAMLARTPTHAPRATMRSSTRARSSTVIRWLARTRSISVRATSAPVWSPCAWTMRFVECAASRPSCSSPRGIEVELRAGGLQLAHARRPLLHQHLDRGGVAQRGAGGEGVLAVERRRVAGTERGGDPALGVGGGAVEQRPLGQQEHVAVLRRAPRGVQSRDAAADHEEARANSFEPFG